jgi:cob(I)alamin adenosyltransferase
MQASLEELRQRQLETGYVHVYTGDGKGKTTAALGLALRAAGAGLRVLFAQFIKGMRYSELEALERFADRITVQQYGRGCFIHGAPAAEDIRCARRGLDEIGHALGAGDYDVVILDEANVAVQCGLFPVEALLALVAGKAESAELVFTGRYAAAALLERADVVTEMREVKHYYHRGIQARVGIER